MPGSPPTRTTDPGTMPPPRTKSNSASPVRQRTTPIPSTADRRMGGWADRLSIRRSAEPPIRRVVRPTASSTSVFHSPHASQRPAHFGCSAPHSVQRNTERALATAGLGRRIPRGAVVEAGEFALEVQRHEARWAVALLADEPLDQALAVVSVFVGRAVVRVGAGDAD